MSVELQSSWKTVYWAGTLRPTLCALLGQLVGWSSQRGVGRKGMCASWRGGLPLYRVLRPGRGQGQAG